MFRHRDKIIVLFISAIFLTSFITYSLAVTTAPSTLTISSGIYPSAADYTLWTESTVTYAKDKNGLTVASDSNSTTIINNLEGNLTSGGTIFLDRTVGIDGMLTINQANTHIVSGGFRAMESGSSWYCTPYITTIKLDSSSEALVNIYISGINFRELTFSAYTNVISNVKIENCGIRPTETVRQQGLIFTGTKLINYVEFIDCWMYDHYEQTGDNRGAIRFVSTANVGSGQYFFTRFHYKAGADDCVMVSWDSMARTDQVLVFDQLDHVCYGHDGHIIFRGRQASKQSVLKVINSNFEEHDNVTIFSFEVGHAGATQKRLITFTGNTATCGDASTNVLTFINNAGVDADYYATTQSYLIGKDNRFLAESVLGTFDLGTTGACAHFIFDVGYTYWDGTAETNVDCTRG